MHFNCTTAAVQKKITHIRWAHTSRIFCIIVDPRFCFCIRCNWCIHLFSDHWPSQKAVSSRKSNCFADINGSDHVIMDQEFHGAEVVGNCAGCSPPSVRVMLRYQVDVAAHARWGRRQDAHWRIVPIVRGNGTGSRHDRLDPVKFLHRDMPQSQKGSVSTPGALHKARVLWPSPRCPAGPHHHHIRISALPDPRRNNSSESPTISAINDEECHQDLHGAGYWAGFLRRWGGGVGCESNPPEPRRQKVASDLQRRYRKRLTNISSSASPENIARRTTIVERELWMHAVEDTPRIVTFYFPSSGCLPARAVDAPRRVKTNQVSRICRPFLGFTTELSLPATARRGTFQLFSLLSAACTARRHRAMWS